MTRTIGAAVILPSLISAAIVAVAAMVHGAGRFEWSWFYPWVLAPYPVLLAGQITIPMAVTYRPAGGMIAGGVAAGARKLAARAPAVTTVPLRTAPDNALKRIAGVAHA